jgi:hypothetical protein
MGCRGLPVLKAKLRRERQVNTLLQAANASLRDEMKTQRDTLLDRERCLIETHHAQMAALKRRAARHEKEVTTAMAAAGVATATAEKATASADSATASETLEWRRRISDANKSVTRLRADNARIANECTAAVEAVDAATDARDNAERETARLRLRLRAITDSRRGFERAIHEMKKYADERHLQIIEVLSHAFLLDDNDDDDDDEQRGSSGVAGGEMKTSKSGGDDVTLLNVDDDDNDVDDDDDDGDIIDESVVLSMTASNFDNIGAFKQPHSTATSVASTTTAAPSAAVSAPRRSRALQAFAMPKLDIARVHEHEIQSELDAAAKAAGGDDYSYDERNDAAGDYDYRGGGADERPDDSIDAAYAQHTAAMDTDELRVFDAEYRNFLREEQAADAEAAAVAAATYGAAPWDVTHAHLDYDDDDDSDDDFAPAPESFYNDEADVLLVHNDSDDGADILKSLSEQDFFDESLERFD